MYKFSANSAADLEEFDKEADSGPCESKFMKFFQSSKTEENKIKESKAAIANYWMRQRFYPSPPPPFDKDAVDMYTVMITEDLEKRYSEIVKEFVRSPETFTIFTNHLHQDVLKTFLEHTFGHATDLPEMFLCGVFAKLVPGAVKSSDNLEEKVQLLFKAHTMDDEKFIEITLPYVMKHGIWEDVLLELMRSLSTEQRNKVLVRLCNIYLSSEAFIVHLRFICELYDIVEKSQTVQSYMKSVLMQNSAACCNNGLFGRLLHTYLQCVHVKDVEFPYLQFLVDTHYSSYRKSCELSLDRLQRELHHLHVELMYQYNNEFNC